MHELDHHAEIARGPGRGSEAGRTQEQGHGAGTLSPAGNQMPPGSIRRSQTPGGHLLERPLHVVEILGQQLLHGLGPVPHALVGILLFGGPGQVTDRAIKWNRLRFHTVVSLGRSGKASMVEGHRRVNAVGGRSARSPRPAPRANGLTARVRGQYRDRAPDKDTSEPQ